MSTDLLTQLGNTARFAVREYRRSVTWERIARRRAELLKAGAYDLEVQKRIVARVCEALEERNRAYDALYTGLQQKWGPKKFQRFLDSLGQQQSGSGREMPQAYQAEKSGTVYRDNNGTVEFWGPSYPYATIEPGWHACGTNFTSMDVVRERHRYAFAEELQPVPSPDCKNCSGNGCMTCVVNHGDDGVHEYKADCPACCG